MKSAFANNRSLSLTIAILFAALALPEIISEFNLVSTFERYALTGSRDTFAYFADEIGHNKEPIDILVIGSSEHWTAVNGSVLEEQIFALTGQHLNVVMLGSSWRWENLYYATIKHIFDNRPVKLVLFSMPIGRSNQREHPYTRYIWDDREFRPAMKDLPLGFRLALFAQSVMGAPRLLLGAIRDSEKYGMSDDFLKELKKSQTTRGSLVSYTGFQASKDAAQQPFEATNFAVPALPPSEMIYRGKDSLFYSSAGASMTKDQALFIGNSYDIAKKHGARFAFFIVTKFGDRSTVLKPTKQHPKVFDGGKPVLGCRATEL